MVVRRLSVPLIAVLAGLALAPAANATPPEHFSFPEEGSDPHFAQCDGFEIGISSAGTTSVTVFFDAKGVPVRFAIHSNLADTFTNSESGKVVVNRGVFQEVFTRIGDTDDFAHTLTGFRFMGTSPGEGVVLQDVGRIVYSGPEEQIVFSAGAHHLLDDGDAATFCAALA
jgi:hypothetical protein